jgi:hypothetical protein
LIQHSRLAGSGNAADGRYQVVRPRDVLDCRRLLFIDHHRAAAGKTFMGVFAPFAYVLALEKNLKLCWHFRAFLCASLRLGLCGGERP